MGPLSYMRSVDRNIIMWHMTVQPKHVGYLQYVTQYILPKCIHWFTVYYNLMHRYETY